MSNSLQLPSEVRSFIDECVACDMRLATVAKRMSQRCFVPDLHFLYENDGFPDPKDKRFLLWYDNEEHINISIGDKSKPKPFLAEDNDKNLNIFIGALVAERRLYAYKHRRKKSTPLLEDNHTLLLKIAIEFAVDKFNTEGLSLYKLGWCVEQSLERNEVMRRFIHKPARRLDTKGLSKDEKKALRAEVKAEDYREKALRSVLSIITAGKEGAPQKEQAELVGVQSRTLRKHIDIVRETLSSKRYRKELLKKEKFTKEQLDSIRLFLSYEAGHDNGVAKRKERKRAEREKVAALFDYSRTLADNRTEINACLGLEWSLQTYYNLLKDEGIAKTKFKNSKTHKDNGKSKKTTQGLG